jgi:ubiquinone biosynthesis protein
MAPQPPAAEPPAVRDPEADPGLAGEGSAAAAGGAGAGADAAPAGAPPTAAAGEAGAGGRAPDEEWEILEERPPPGLLRRLFATWRHLNGLLFGGLAAVLRERPAGRRHGLPFRLAQLTAALSRPFVDRHLRKLPFPVQFRRRLELLGPTYIKLGQILSLREDLLPEEVTQELKNLLDRLPVVPFPRFLELVAEGVGRPVDEMFTWVDPRPLGSASIAQAHRATTREGDDAILKVVKPGIRQTLRRDAVLLRAFGGLLQLLLPRFEPRRVIREFVTYTLREVDLEREADNAETFAANFKDLPDVVFPRIYRRYSSDTVLCMEFLDGLKPSDPRVQALPAADKSRLVDLGAGAIIRMLFRDGFFHADLHPANLLVLAGPKAGFVDLGMVGRFDDDLRRTLLYYYYCLVMGDADNASRYLAAVAEGGPGADPVGFRREVQDISRRWKLTATFEGFSLGQLILQSVGRAAQFRMYFPVEMVLMVKALVTFEGVGRILDPGLDVAKVSQTHVQKIFLHQFSPLRLAQETLRGGPEIVDALVKTPMLITEGLKVLEQATRRPPENPFTGIRGTLFAGFCLLAAAILASNALWIPAAILALAGLALALRPGR